MTQPNEGAQGRTIKLHSFPIGDEQDIAAHHNARRDDSDEKQKAVPEARIKLGIVGALIGVDFGIIYTYRSLPLLDYDGLLSWADRPLLLLVSLQAVLGVFIFKYLVDNSTDRVAKTIGWLAAILCTLTVIGWAFLATGNELKEANGGVDNIGFSIVPADLSPDQLGEVASLGSRFVAFMIDVIPLSMFATNLVFVALPVIAALLAKGAVPPLIEAARSRKRLAEFEQIKGLRDKERQTVEETRAEIEALVGSQLNRVKQAGLDLAVNAERKLDEWDKVLISNRVLSKNEKWDGNGETNTTFVVPVGTPGGSINVDDPAMLANIIAKARSTLAISHINTLFEDWQKTAGQQISDKVVFVDFAKHDQG